jgi:hypothetical protein
VEMVGSSRNCQLSRTCFKTVLSHGCLAGCPSLTAACSLSSVVRYQAFRCEGISEVKNQPSNSINQQGSNSFLLDSYLPKIAVAIVIVDKIRNLYRHAGRLFLPANDPSGPAWIHPPAILPRCPKQTNTAALVSSSDFL